MLPAPTQAAYGDGKHMVLRFEPETASKVSFHDIARAITSSGFTSSEVESMQPLGKLNWVIKFHNLENAEAATGKPVTFLPKDAEWAPKDGLTLSLTPYYASGPSIFVTEHPGPAADIVFLSALCRLHKGYKMYVAADTMFGIRGGKRMVILDRPGTFYKFDMEVDKFLVTFRAVNQAGQCGCCGAPHKTATCGLWVPMAAQDLAQILSKPPVV
jgi:hypothetical protein